MDADSDSKIVQGKKRQRVDDEYKEDPTQQHPPKKRNTKEVAENHALASERLRKTTSLRASKAATPPPQIPSIPNLRPSSSQTASSEPTKAAIITTEPTHSQTIASRVAIPSFHTQDDIAMVDVEATNKEVETTQARQEQQ